MGLIEDVDSILFTAGVLPDGTYGEGLQTFTITEAGTYALFVSTGKVFDGFPYSGGINNYTVTFTSP